MMRCLQTFEPKGRQPGEHGVENDLPRNKPKNMAIWHRRRELSMNRGHYGAESQVGSFQASTDGLMK